MRRRESRKERERRWAEEDAAWKASGMAGGHMVEVGTLRRGLRGKFAYDFRARDAEESGFWRDDETDGPESLRVFVFWPRGGTEDET